MPAKSNLKNQTTPPNQKRPEMGIDKYLIYLSLCGVFLFLHLLNDDSLFEKTKEANGKKIGNITKPIQDVRRRTKNEFSWLPINNNDLVFLGDSIYTGDKSTVTVSLDNGVNLLVDPDSLVVLDPNSDDVKLNLKFGNVKGKLANNTNSSINLNINDQELKLDGASVEFTLEKKNTANVQLKVIEGNAKITEAVSKKQFALPKKHQVKFNREIASIQNLKAFEEEIEFVRIEQWGMDKSFWLNEKQPLKFLWQVEGLVDHYEISIAQKSNMKEPLVKEVIKVNGFSWLPNFDNGTIFWQIKAFKDKTKFVESPIIHWDIGILSAPEWENIENPKVISKIDLSESMNPQNESIKVLRWNTKLKSQLYRLEWSKNFDFKEKSSIELKDNKWLIPNLDVGKYFLRVRSESIGRPASIWSSPLVLKILDKDPDGLISPTLAVSEVETLEKVEPMNVNWQSQEKTNLYSVELSDQIDFSKIIQSITIKGSTWKASPLSKGTYYLRLFPLSDKGRRGPVSKTLVWHSRARGPVWSYAKNELKIIIPRDKEDKLMSFPETFLSWNVSGQKNVKEFLLTHSVSDQFVNPTEIKVSTNQFKLIQWNPGEYYFKVKAVFNDQSTSLFSSALKLSVIEDGLFEWRAPQWLTEGIDSLLDTDSKVNAQFQWKKLEKINNYKIQISEDREFQKILIDQQLVKNNFQHTMTVPGDLFIRVSGVTEKGRVGPWSKSIPWIIRYGKPKLITINDIIASEPKQSTIQWSAHDMLKSFKLEVTKIDPVKNDSPLGDSKGKITRKEASESLGSSTQIFNDIVKGNSYSLKLTQSGKYKVRVQGVSEQGRELTSYSDPINFKFALRRILTTPVLLVPKNKVSYILSNLKNPEVWLQWIKTKDGDQYSIEVAKDTKFKKVIISKTITENRLLIDHKAIKGKLYWRVKGLSAGDDGSESSWSEPWTFSIVEIESED